MTFTKAFHDGKNRSRQAKRPPRRGTFTAAGFLCALLLALTGLGGCGKEEEEAETGTDYTVVGFSQLGAESDWRSSNTESIQSVFTEENGYELIYENGQQKQSNQITAIRTFIQQEVDYIVLAPVTEVGWDTVLQEARDARIPVILIDRRVDTEDSTLYTAWVGSNFYLEGCKAAAWLQSFTEKAGIAAEDLHIVNIQGTIGATAQIGRTRGLREACERNGWDLLEEISGDFTQTKGKEVMESLLRTYDNINVVYCENDNEALGAIEALEAAGYTVGSDLAAGEIMVISFDGINQAAVEYLKNGKISCIVECNPLQGPKLLEVIEQLKKGETPPRYSYMEEKIFSANRSVLDVEVDGNKYPVTFMWEE